MPAPIKVSGTSTFPISKSTNDFRKRIESNMLDRLSDPRHAWPSNFVPIAVRTEQERVDLQKALTAMAPAMAKRGITVKYEALVQPTNGSTPFVRVAYSLDPAKVSKKYQTLLKAGVDREVNFIKDQLKGNMSSSGEIMRALWSDRDMGDYSSFIKNRVAPELKKQGIQVWFKSLVETGVEKLGKLGWSR